MYLMWSNLRNFTLHTPWLLCLANNAVRCLLYLANNAVFHKTFFFEKIALVHHCMCSVGYVMIFFFLQMLFSHCPVYTHPCFFVMGQPWELFCWLPSCLLLCKLDMQIWLCFIDSGGECMCVLQGRHTQAFCVNGHAHTKYLYCVWQLMLMCRAFEMHIIQVW